jgi:hypothetical protein
MVWNTEEEATPIQVLVNGRESTLNRGLSVDELKAEIKRLAVENNIRGKFRVYFDGEEVSPGDISEDLIQEVQEIEIVPQNVVG